ncbi:MAG: RnfABCDGE type electron transport complex subunit B [Bacilli bacterium]
MVFLSETVTENYWMYALYAFLILLGIGIVLGAVLVWATKFFHVEEDPRIKDVEKLLPGANCGNCGYPGCHELAEALVKGEAKKSSQCKVGNADKNFKPIAEYMKSHPDKDGKTNIPGI